MVAVVGFVLPKIIMPTNFDSMIKQMVIWNKQVLIHLYFVQLRCCHRDFGVKFKVVVFLSTL